MRQTASGEGTRWEEDRVDADMEQSDLRCH